MLLKLLPLPAALALAACATVPPMPVAPVEVGIVAINDFHGALEPPRQYVTAPNGQGGTVAVPAGGAAWLASAVDSVRAKYPNHVTVAAGDLISASPLTSSIYLDEPAIGVMNRIGLDITSVGNHEFDRGRDELLRDQNGGCAKFTQRQPCGLEPFTGAKFSYLAASTLKEDGTPLFPATALRSFGSGRAKVTIGFIGLTLKGTADIVVPTGIKGLRFADEADTINAWVPRLKAQGADAIVVLLHQGGAQQPDVDPDSCAGFTGDIRPILDRLDTRVDLVVSGHTHRAYVCDYATLNAAKPFLLTSAGHNGELVTDVALEIDPATHRVVGKKAHNVIVQSVGYTGSRGPISTTPLFQQFSPRADVADYVGKYVAATRDFSARPAGALAAPASGRILGQIVADAQLAATRSAGAQIALMNPGGIRAQLVPRASGAVTFGDIYAVQPFGNTLVTLTLTGAELRKVLEESLAGSGDPHDAIPSQGLAYSFDLTKPEGSRLVSLTFNGQPIDPTANYRVTTSNFLASGGDGYVTLKAGSDVTQGGVDLDALEAWLKTSAPRTVPTQERAVDVNKPPAAAAPSTS